MSDDEEMANAVQTVKEQREDLDRTFAIFGTTAIDSTERL